LALFVLFGLAGRVVASASPGCPYHRSKRGGAPASQIQIGSDTLLSADHEAVETKKVDYLAVKADIKAALTDSN
ncbi:hypothetical protein HDU93_006750, partial [Gonapodya sp. JEL0774]